MNLDRLHSPQPLRDADFAAIRARVRGEIAARRQHGSAWLLLWRIAFAASLIVLLVPHTRDGVWIAEAPAAALPAALPAPPSQSGNSVAAVQTPKRTPKHHRKPKREPETAISRIEIHTADPDIRIIWIIHPKESS
jgi:hypothetical protein